MNDLKTLALLFVIVSLNIQGRKMNNKILIIWNFYNLIDSIYFILYPNFPEARKLNIH